MAQLPKPLKDLTKLIESDLPMEIFADSSAHYGLVHLHFSVMRFGEPKPPNPPKGKRIPCARLVMPVQTAVELYNGLEKMMGLFEQQGLIKRDAGKPIMPPSTTVN